MQKKLNNIKQYDKFDLFIIFLEIGINLYISRNELSQKYSIGEGSIKSILVGLENKGLIKKSQKGSSLTIKGTKVYKQFLKILTHPNELNFDIFKYKKEEKYLTPYYTILKDFNNKKIKQLYVSRDHAIRNGCWSAMVLEKINNQIKIPLIDDGYDFNILENYIEKIENNQILIITSAQNLRITFKGIFAILNYLSKKFNSLFEENFKIK